MKYRDYDKYVLKYLYDVKESVHKNNIYDKIKEYTNLSDEDLKLVKENGYSKFNDRVDWSLVVLKKAQLIENIDKGIYQITDFGKKFYEENPNFDFKILKEKTPYLENSKSNSDDDDIEEIENENRNEIGKSIEEYYESVEKDILARLQSMGESNVDKGTRFEKYMFRIA